MGHLPARGAWSATYALKCPSAGGWYLPPRVFDATCHLWGRSPVWSSAHTKKLRCFTTRSTAGANCHHCRPRDIVEAGAAFSNDACLKQTVTQCPLSLGTPAHRRTASPRVTQRHVAGDVQRDSTQRHVAVDVQRDSASVTSRSPFNATQHVAVNDQRIRAVRAAR